MKTLVAYFTQTGNTQLIAEAIHEVFASRGESDISTVRKVNLNKLNEYDLLVVGAPCHDSDLASPVKGFLESLSDSPPFKLAGFFTHATYMSNQEGRGKELYESWAGKCIPTFETTCNSKNIEFLGCFNCQGKANPGIEAFIRQEIIHDNDEWNEYLPELRKHPDSTDIESAKKFALDILGKV
ncbi:MAG: flavodoxin family protein [Candidatus Thorarchaeota archaeon]|jgi:flavodoxin